MVNADLPDVIEIWNNVFIQYNREADGSLRQLPAQHVDTGMGFERLTSILQGVDSNYDTDIFQPIFAAIQKETGARPYQGKVGPVDDPQFIDMAYRVVADHIRTLCFAIADGAVPSNDGRGYVLRRVLRRAVRFGRQNLGAELGFFTKLVPTVVQLMGETFPELVEKQAHVTAILLDEEQSFNRTLDKGVQAFTQMVEKVTATGDDKTPKEFSGTDAFFLYDTMGFPIDLTELMAEEKGLTVDRQGFEAKLEEGRELSRQEYSKRQMAGMSGKDMRLVAEQTAHLVNVLSAPPTDDVHKYTWNQDLTDCTVKALFLGRNETEDKIGFVNQITAESGTVGILLDKTSFYAESGGQVYDTGSIVPSNADECGLSIQVNNVQLYGQFVLHVGQVVVTEGCDESKAVWNVDDKVTCRVDYQRRAPIAANHTMTHVLNYALKKVLIQDAQSTSATSTLTDIDQKGSYQDETKSRFDFSWNAALTSDQLQAVEQVCVERIEGAFPVESYVAPLAEAEKVSSLRAVFGEKYPDPVRVVAVAHHSITDMLANPQDSQWYNYSVEFCGGTHLTNTKEAQAFCLLSEEGIAKGIRRIVFVTQDDAKRAIAEANAFEAKLKEASSLEGEALDGKVKTLSQELSTLSISAARKAQFRDGMEELTRKVIAYKKQRMAAMSEEVVAKAVELAATTEGDKVVLRSDFGVDGKVGKQIMTGFCKKVKDKALFLVSAGDKDIDGNKFLVVAGAPKAVSKSVDCKAWATAATVGTDGKGGGKPEMAQFHVAGLQSIDIVLEQARKF